MIGFLYPEICNQQGDQGYRDWLEVNGVKTVSAEDKPLAKLEGLVVGDVSERGALILRERLADHWLIGEIEKGLTILAIGRSGTELARLLGVEVPNGSYKSQYVEYEFEGTQLYGYVNGLHSLSKLVTEVPIGKGRLIQCALLGPVCVVNRSFESYCFGIETPERDALAEHYKNLVTD